MHSAVTYSYVTPTQIPYILQYILIIQVITLIISDRLCLSVLTFYFISVIGISVKSHIGASLVRVAMCNSIYCNCQSSGGTSFSTIPSKLPRLATITILIA